MTDASTSIRRPGPHAWIALMGAEARMVFRDTAGLVIPLGLPLLILVMNGISGRVDQPIGIDGMTVFELYVMPLVITIVVATVGVVNMPSFLAAYRRFKVLRRLAVTPAHPAMILVAQMVVGIVQTVAGVALGMVVALTAFDVALPRSPWTALAVFGLVVIAMFALGMFVAAVAPTANSAVAIGLTMFFAIGATGGMFGPTDSMPEVMGRIGELLPFGAAVQAIGNAWVGTEQNPVHLIALTTAIVLSSAAAMRWFRWD